MEDRLLKILKYYNLSATKFADLIGVQRSSVSHIISGRNRPSFDFIVRVMNKFEELNSEWLILGKGEMMKQKDTISGKEIEKKLIHRICN